MSGAPTLVPAGRPTTTYAQLTGRAARCIARAQDRASSEVPGGRRPNESDVAAHRDLAAALVHLGSTLTGPLGPAATAAQRRGGPDARLLRSLEAVARRRDWSEPGPSDGPGSALAEAAFLIRSAADLWATHHSSDGRPRSPEASRMRHPSTLGAASREWRRLVALTAAAGDALAGHSGCATLGESVVADLRRFPRPRSDSRAPAAVPGLLDLTVARPGIRRGHPPLEELSDRIRRLRQLAWTLAEVGSAPATVHGNLAAIGIALHRAAASAHRSLAAGAPDVRARDRHLDAAVRLEEGESRWRDVAAQVRALRTPHPSTHPIQIERLDIDRLLRRAAPSGLPLMRPEVGWSLSRMADSFCEIAAHNAAAVRAAQDAGDLLLVGRAIPTEALPRRPDLLEARLTDQVIPAPTTVITRLEASYRAIARESRTRESRTAEPRTAEPRPGAKRRRGPDAASAPDAPSRTA
jgi:hypothetical protein